MGKVRSYVTSMIVQCLPPGAINKSHGISSTNNPKLCPICKEITWLCLQHGEISSAFKKRSPFTGIWSHIKKPVFWYYHCRAWGKNKPRLMVDQWKKSRSNNIETQQTQRLEVEKNELQNPSFLRESPKKITIGPPIWSAIRFPFIFLTIFVPLKKIQGHLWTSFFNPRNCLN